MRVLGHMHVLGEFEDNAESVASNDVSRDPVDACLRNGQAPHEARHFLQIMLSQLASLQLRRT